MGKWVYGLTVYGYVAVMITTALCVVAVIRSLIVGGMGGLIKDLLEKTLGGLEK